MFSSHLCYNRDWEGCEAYLTLNVTNMTKPLTFPHFLRGLPEQVWPHLPPELGRWQVRQPWVWLVQLYDQQPTVHYEVGRARPADTLEVGLHFEQRDAAANAALLRYFQQRLVEIKDQLGPEVEAEPWDKGWAKVYLLMSASAWTVDLQHTVGQRLADFMTILHPFLLDYRRTGRTSKTANTPRRTPTPSHQHTP